MLFFTLAMEVAFISDIKRDITILVEAFVVGKMVYLLEGVLIK